MSAAEFYDALAPFFHLIFEDWQASIDRQGAALDSVIRSFPGEPRRSVLDVACGIGTQSLGLAARGYEVTGSDLSPGAVQRARAEAAQRDLSIPFSVADMRAAHEHHGREFDVVLCADNSLPHLLSDEEIATALGEFFRCTKPGGLAVISVRDYDALERGGAQIKPHRVRYDGGVRYVLFQVWEWRGPLYDMSFYVVRDEGGGECSAQVARATYYAVSIPVLIRLMEAAGFVEVRRIDDVFYQPLIVGVRPDGPYRSRGRPVNRPPGMPLAHIGGFYWPSPGCTGLAPRGTAVKEVVMRSPNSILTAVILTLAIASPAAIAAAESPDLSQAKKKPSHTNGGRGGEDLTQMRFAGMDTNHDGRITRNEWRGNDVSFNQHDWNGDGVLSGPEVTPGAQRPVDFNSLDRNHDGRISLSEWPGSRALFNFLDLNDDSFLSPTELGRNGSLLIGGRLDDLFRALDINHDSRISRTEWTFDLAVFDRLDANHDALLTINELRRIHGLLGGDDDDEGEDDEGEREEFQRLDTNHDNRISRSEWRGNLRSFDRLDTNHDGFLSLDEFLNHHH